jgi:hypothetical protein
MRRFCVLALIAALVGAAPAAFGQGKAKAYKVSGFVGKSTTEAAPGVAVVLLAKESGEVVGTDQTNFFGKYTIKNVPPGVYIIQVEKIERTLAVKDKNVRLDIDLSAEGGTMDYLKGGLKQVEADQQRGGAGAPPAEGAAGGTGEAGGAAGATDTGLMSYFAGEYYSFTSGSTLYGSAGTERKMTLCSDGLYRDSSESGAYGSGQWGSASAQSGGAARWSIQGDKTQGTITVTYANGKSKRFNYRVLSKEEQTISFDGVKFVYAGAAKCR